jgi:hypothetical protein
MKPIFTLLLSLFILIGQAQEEKYEFEMCDNLAYVTLAYFSDTITKGELHLEVYKDKSKKEPVVCMTVWVSDKLTSVAKVFTSPIGSVQLLYFKPGIYDVEFHYNDQYFRYYDVVISPFNTTTKIAFLDQFLDKKTYLKQLRKHSKNRWQ